MVLWPILLTREMYEEPPVRPVAVGDVISWDVRPVDGTAEGWPAELLVSATVQFPQDSDPGTDVPTIEVGGTSLPWDANAPVPSELSVQAGLSADWWLPAEDSVVTGIVRQVYRLFENLVWVRIGICTRSVLGG